MEDRLTTQEVFETLRPEQVHTLSEFSDKLKLAAGDTVYRRGDRAGHFYAVLEGEVTLRMPGKSGVSIAIDQLGKGAMFGSCVSLERDAYALTAQCTKDTQLLRTDAAVLRNLMNQDPMMGYNLQSRISQIYFNRYVETMKKLQAIVMNIPIEMD